MMSPVRTEVAVVADAPEILALQRLAFQSEADLYGRDIGPLTRYLATWSNNSTTTCS